MEIEFDPDKRLKTLVERDLDMADAGLVFQARHVTFPDLRRAYSEQRFVTFGHIADRMVCIAWTPRAERTRVISMRTANAREEKRYAHLFGR